MSLSEEQASEGTEGSCNASKSWMSGSYTTNGGFAFYQSYVQRQQDNVEKLFWKNPVLTAPPVLMIAKFANQLSKSCNTPSGDDSDADDGRLTLEPEALKSVVKPATKKTKKSNFKLVVKPAAAAAKKTKKSKVDKLIRIPPPMPAPNRFDTYQCSKCNASFGYHKWYKLHMKQKHGIKLDGYRCRHCKLKFKSEYVLRQHQQKNHPESKRLHCNTCNREFVLEHHLKHHVATHSTEKNFACRVCRKPFSSLQRVKSHEMNRAFCKARIEHVLNDDENVICSIS